MQCFIIIAFKLHMMKQPLRRTKKIRKYLKWIDILAFGVCILYLFIM